MTIYIPWGLVAIFISFYFFYSINRKNKLKKEERLEYLKQRLEELLQSLGN